MSKLAWLKREKGAEKRAPKPAGGRLRRLWARTGLERYMSPATALCYPLALAWLCVIFIFGGQTGETSQALSESVTQFIADILSFLSIDAETLHIIIRKLAHGGVFCVLAILSMFAVGGTVKHKLKAILLVAAFCVLTAAGNEVEQLFVEGRGASGVDVLIDMAGATLGMFISCLFLYIIPARRQKRLSGVALRQVFEKDTQWLCLSRFALIPPVNVWTAPPAKARGANADGAKTEDANAGDANAGDAKAGDANAGDAKADGANAEAALAGVHMYARRAFRLGKRVTDAKLRITADDMYKLYVNGQYVCQGPAPGYPGRYYVNEIELKPYLRAGENVLALHVYYQGLINRVWVSGDMRQGFQLEFRVNGKMLFRSDGNFRCLESAAWKPMGKVGYDTQFLEEFDGRLEPSGWKHARFDDSDWKHGALKRSTDYTFVMQPTPVLETREVQPASVKEAQGRYLCDFGGEISGVLIINAEGPEGARVYIRTGEELDASGGARWKTRCNCDYEEAWILPGGACEYEGYDYRGMRYAEIEAPEGVKITRVTARAQGYPLDMDACVLESGDKALNRVFELCKRTIREGVQEGYIDCPTREKGQYAGDLFITSLAHAYISGDTRLMQKAIDDWMHSSALPGGPYSVFPCAYRQKIADYSLLFPRAALRLYEHTGDKEYLKRTYVASQAVLSAYRIYERADGLIEHVTEAWNMVDWPQNLRDGYDFKLDIPIGAGCHNVINAYYLDAVGVTERIAKILGEECKPRFPLLCRAFDACFFDAQTGLYVDAEGSKHTSQHSCVLPLCFGICRKEREGRLADFLIEGGMRVGVYMAFFYLKALAQAGRHGAVYDFITSDSENSWLNMLSEGATTLFEAWGKDKKWNTSLCHPWACAPVAVLIEDILGITPETANGAPWRAHLPDKLMSLNMRVPVCGKIVTVERDEELTTITMKWKG